MKKHLLVVIALTAILAFAPSVTNSQTGFNTAVEYCTGTWCQWCPCSHGIIEGILQSYPNTVILAYHGPSNDPWTSTGLPMIQLFGFNAYPTGVVGRRTGIISNTGWSNRVTIQSLTEQPGVSIAVNNKQYNTGTRTLSASIVLTALTNLTGDYYIFMAVTENNLVYPQTGNGSCPGSSSYVHYNVVRGLVNGTTGTLLNTTDNWTQGNSVTVPLSYVLPAGILEQNSNINIVVYKGGGVVHTDQLIQQSKKEGITLTGIEPVNGVPTSYNLEQNYPNPFNPTTNIKFSIPEAGNVSLKFYDLMGREVASYLNNEFLNAGVYNADFDGSKLSSGVYFYTLSTKNFTETKKMMLVK